MKKNISIGFIGAGKMATALAKGIISKGIVDENKIIASDIHADSAKKFTQICGAKCINSNIDILKSSNIIILAVKPQVAEKAVSGLDKYSEGKLIISIAAGLKLNVLKKWFGTSRIIRVMPNTPAMISLGASVFAVAEGVCDDDKEIAQQILSSVGIVKEMPEEKLDLVTGLSGSGPAYIFEMVKAMADAGEKLGLSYDDSLDLTVQTVLGSAEMLRRKIGTPDELRDAVTSPGGTTFAGLSVLKKSNFREIMFNVIKKAEERSIELGN